MEAKLPRKKRKKVYFLKSKAVADDPYEQVTISYLFHYILTISAVTQNLTTRDLTPRRVSIIARLCQCCRFSSTTRRRYAASSTSRMTPTLKREMPSEIMQDL